MLRKCIGYFYLVRVQYNVSSHNYVGCICEYDPWQQWLVAVYSLVGVTGALPRNNRNIDFLHSLIIIFTPPPPNLNSTGLTYSIG